MTYSTKGAVVFSVDGKPRTFKYSLSVVEDKLRIWVEDTVTFEEWQTAELGIADFVTLDTAIPQAKAKDYAMNIAKSLEQSSKDGEPDPLCRSLSRPSADTGARILFVAVVFKAMEFTTTLEYTFMLQSLTVDHSEKLLVENEQLQHAVKSLTAEVEQIKKLQTAVKRLTDENEQLKTEVQALTVEDKAGAETPPPAVLVSPLHQLLMNGNRLVAVQSHHWLFECLKHHKRNIHHTIAAKAVRDSQKSVAALNTEYVTALLQDKNKLELATTEIAQQRSELFVAAAATYGALNPYYDAVAIEGTLVQVLKEWRSTNTDIVQFTASFHARLKAYVHPQYVVDLFDILTMIPYYYKTQIDNQQLKDLISRSLLDGRNAEGRWSKLLDERLMDPTNQSLLHAYMAWIGQEFVAVGLPAGGAKKPNLLAVAEIVMNPMHLQPNWYLYFPFGATMNQGLCSKVWKDHCGEIYDTRSDGNSVYFPGFLYYGASS